MITEWQVQRRGETILLGIAIQNALFDIVTHRGLLLNCLTMLESPHVGLVNKRLGQFADLPVTLNLHHDDAVSIFIDGPDFTSSRNQSAAIWVEKDELQNILRQVVDAG